MPPVQSRAPEPYIRGSKFARNLSIREEIRDDYGRWKRIVSVSIAGQTVYVGLWRSRAAGPSFDASDRVRYRKARAGYGELCV